MEKSLFEPKFWGQAQKQTLNGLNNCSGEGRFYSPFMRLESKGKTKRRCVKSIGGTLRKWEKAEQESL